MRDAEIRHALLHDLVEPGTRLWPEMSIGLGATRVDVGRINGTLSGFEIKSEHDNLMRLPAQIVHYGRCLDQATIVVTPKRCATIADHVPSWWGVLQADAGSTGPELSWFRKPSHNPHVEPFYVAQLLWRDEALATLQLHGQQDGLHRATRWKLWDRLAEALALDDLRREVRRWLRARQVTRAL